MSDKKPAPKPIADIPVPASKGAEVKGGKSPHSEDEEKLQR